MELAIAGHSSSLYVEAGAVLRDYHKLSCDRVAARAQPLQDCFVPFIPITCKVDKMEAPPPAVYSSIRPKQQAHTNSGNNAAIDSSATACIAIRGTRSRQKFPISVN